MAKFRHPRLITPNAREYLDFCSRHAATNRLTRIGGRRVDHASSQAGIVFEEIVRAGLSQGGRLSDKRILAFEEARLGRGHLRRYRELDAVSVRSDTRVFEVKSSCSPNGIRAGVRQLRRTAAILRSGSLGTARPLVLLLIWVDTSANRNFGDVEWKEIRNLHDLRALVHLPLAPGSPHVFRIAADVAWKWSGELGLEIDENLPMDLRAEIADAETRRSLKGGGVPDHDRPVDLKQPRNTDQPISYSSSPP